MHDAARLSAILIPLSALGLTAALLLSCITASVFIEQSGLCADIRIELRALFGAVRVPLSYRLRFSLSGGFRFFKVTKRGERELKKRDKRDKRGGRKRNIASTLIPALTVAELRLTGRVGLVDDAAAGVMLAGALNALFNAAVAFSAGFAGLRFASEPMIFLSPAFDETAFSLNLAGIVKTYTAKLLKSLIGGIN